MRYKPPSYFPKNAFAPGSASNVASPSCHSCCGHGSGLMPGLPSACGRSTKLTANDTAGGGGDAGPAGIGVRNLPLALAGRRVERAQRARRLDGLRDKGGSAAERQVAERGGRRRRTAHEPHARLARRDEEETALRV